MRAGDPSYVTLFLSLTSPMTTPKAWGNAPRDPSSSAFVIITQDHFRTNTLQH